MEYYEKNKTFSEIKNKEKIECKLCNTFVQRWNINKHNKTKKHIQNELNKQTFLQLTDEHKQFVLKFNTFTDDDKKTIIYTLK